MKINEKNYFKYIQQIGFENLPLPIKQAHLVIMQKSDNGKNWKNLEQDTALKQVKELAFKKLAEFILFRKSDKSLNGVSKTLTPRKVAIELIKPYVLKGDTLSLHPSLGLSVREQDYAAHIEGEKVVVSRLYGTEIREEFDIKELMQEITSTYFKEKYPEHKSTPSMKRKRTSYQHKQPEFKAIKAILNWHNKKIFRRQVEFFVKELQEYIRSGQITKKSPVAKEIALLQDKLVQIYNTMGEAVVIKLSDDFKKKMQQALLKVTDKKKIKNPKNNKGGLDGLDRLNTLNESKEQTPVQPQTQQQKGVEEKKQTSIINSVDFTNLHFDCIGFQGKWLELIGDPSPGFTAMVYGKPKMGKSFLCVDFAGYLARNFGKVLYVAKEEKLDHTLQQKLKQKEVAHPNLDVSDSLPDDINAYDFVFLDSVNLLGLSVEDLRKLKENFPKKSFIYIFQTTKTGNFRGANAFQHDVDIVIDVPQRGKAIQFGRYNQGGEMLIFEQDATTLNGIENKKTNKMMQITTELGIPLQELAMELFSKKSDYSKIVDMLDTDPKRVEKTVLLLAQNYIKKQKAKVEIKKIEFKEMDSSNLNHGAAYFEAIMQGNKTELKKIANSDSLFYYEWEGLNGNKGKKKNAPAFNPEVYKSRKDDENPIYIFSLTSSRLLSEAIKGEFDLLYLAKRELANRGQDENGKWVGFDKAKEMHRMD
jgi:hypothetical protein